MGWTKKKLAIMSGLHPSTLSRMGKDGIIKDDVQASICKALDCKLADICEVRKKKAKK